MNRGTSFRINVTIENVSRTKFQTVLYRGKRSFTPSQKLTSANLNQMVSLVSNAAQLDDAASLTAEEQAQTDIWKISGATAYFFNQLRGLQVIDLGTPSGPHLIASLRLPAARKLVDLPSSL